MQIVINPHLGLFITSIFFLGLFTVIYSKVYGIINKNDTLKYLSQEP